MCNPLKCCVISQGLPLPKLSLSHLSLTHPLTSHPLTSHSLSSHSHTSHSHISLTHSMQVERVRDESVWLRALQTALTLMQNPLFADDEVWIGTASVI